MRMALLVTLLAADGSSLAYSTYLGGSANDVAHRIGLDSAGGVHLVGATTSDDFPLANPLQPEHGGGSDGFVAKLHAEGSALVYSTYLGGSGEDLATGLAIDSTDQAHVVGTTDSADFPLLLAYQLEFLKRVVHAHDLGLDQLGQFAPLRL